MGKLLKIIITVFLAAILALRIYAIFFTVYVTTPWDDEQFRKTAITNEKSSTLLESVGKIFIPYSPLAGTYGRYSFYTDWLVFGLKIFGNQNPQLSFQLVNLVLMLIQGIMLYLFSWRISKDRVFSLVTVFLYLSAPIIFGINRWVMSENFVLASFFVSVFLGFWLLLRPPPLRTPLKEVTVSALTAYVLAIFSVPREYTILTTLVIYGCVVAGLLWEKRYFGAATFMAVFLPFCRNLKIPLMKFLGAFSAGGKFNAEGYFHPFSEWIPHAFIYAVGPALSIFLLFLFILCVLSTAQKLRQLFEAGALVKQLRNAALALAVILGAIVISSLAFFIRSPLNAQLLKTIERQKIGLILIFAPFLVYFFAKTVFWLVKGRYRHNVYNLKGADILSLGYLLLFVIYAAGIVISPSRTIRNVIIVTPPFMVLMLLAAGSLPLLENTLKKITVKSGYICLILLSWAVLWYQLFFAFDGGKTYVIHPFGLEFYNHPMHIRSLQGPGDSHIYKGGDGLQQK